MATALEVEIASYRHPDSKVDFLQKLSIRVDEASLKPHFPEVMGLLRSLVVPFPEIDEELEMKLSSFPNLDFNDDSIVLPHKVGLYVIQRRM